MRLIDADRALEIVHDQGIAHPNAYYLTNYATLILREAPTIEAEPVRHGRWKYDSHNLMYYCTECNKEPCKYIKTMLDGSTIVEEFLTDYCPNCGAKMDGGAD